jgi:hypothetical protein
MCLPLNDLSAPKMPSPLIGQKRFNENVTNSTFRKVKFLFEALFDANRKLSHKEEILYESITNDRRPVSVTLHVDFRGVVFCQTPLSGTHVGGGGFAPSVYLSADPGQNPGNGPGE